MEIWFYSTSSCPCFTENRHKVLKVLKVSKMLIEPMGNRYLICKIFDVFEINTLLHKNFSVIVDTPWCSLLAYNLSVSHHCLDLIVQAKSGTGKTCVFAVIALEMVLTTSLETQVR